LIDYRNKNSSWISSKDLTDNQTHIFKFNDEDQSYIGRSYFLSALMIGQVNETDKRLQVFRDGDVFEFDDFEVLMFKPPQPEGMNVLFKLIQSFSFH
jgi:hypothetical protein